MDTKVKGIILKLTDYKEADKLASIFCLDEGVITANFRGVRKEKSKMKSACMPFTFAEFNLNQTGSTRVVTSENVIDGFYGILQDYNKTISAYIVLDIIKTILPAEKPEVDLFVLTLDALKQIETSEPFNALASFIIKFIAFCGMGLNFDIDKYAYLNKTTGEFEPTASISSMQIDKKVFTFLKQANLNAVDPTTAEATKKQALRLLNTVLLIKFNAEVRAFNFI